MMGSYQTPESKKEEYRKYLQTSGVTDAITKVLVALYEEPERPANAMEYIRMNLGIRNQTSNEMEELKAANEELRKRVKYLEQMDKKL